MQLESNFLDNPTKWPTPTPTNEKPLQKWGAKIRVAMISNTRPLHSRHGLYQAEPLHCDFWKDSNPLLTEIQSLPLHYIPLFCVLLRTSINLSSKITALFKFLFLFSLQFTFKIHDLGILGLYLINSKIRRYFHNKVEQVTLKRSWSYLALPIVLWNFEYSSTDRITKGGVNGMMPYRHWFGISCYLLSIFFPAICLPSNIWAWFIKISIIYAQRHLCFEI